MNTSTSFGVPNYSTASSEIKMSNYNSTSSYWTAPYNCFATFYIKSTGGAGDSLWAIYAQASGSSAWNRAAGGGSGTYSAFEGAQLFFKANDKIYMTLNQSASFNKVYMTYYRLTSA